MKNYTITVNGTAYDVTVEETNGSGAALSQYPSMPAKRTAAPIPEAPAPKASASVTAGSVTVAAPMPGKILGVKAAAGQAVKKGEVIVILEAMKMESEIIAPQDGTIASVHVATGDTVEAGAVLATLN